MYKKSSSDLLRKKDEKYVFKGYKFLGKFLGPVFALGFPKV